MACPFLTEGRAQYCHAAPMRKLILDGPGVSEGGLCKSAEFQQCELADKNSNQKDRCSHLEEVHVQYCSASPITKLVPFSDSQLSRCSGASYRFCESYLAHARPHPTAPPSDLLYAPNHFWLDVDESGLCHIGIDNLLADVAGEVEGIDFATSQGVHCPGLTVTIHGVEWPMFFPNFMEIRKVNNRVRTDPSKLTTDPYGVGWLFEGQELHGITRAGLLTGKQVAAWQKGERDRLAHEVHEMQAPGCDGGMTVRGVARLLPRPELVCLCQQFFGNSGWLVEE
jgi:glycine cleavage system H lipoate-binding protein